MTNRVFRRLTETGAAFVTGAALLIGAAQPAGATITTEAELKAAIEAITAAYQPQLDELTANGAALSQDLPSDIEVITGMEWETVTWTLDVPEVTMVLQTWKLHIPEFVMRPQTWIFSLPEICMVYHPFPWGGGLDLPSICMREHRWELMIPEVTMVEHTWKLHIPEVTMRSQTWTFEVPKFAGDVEADLEARKHQGAVIAAKAEELLAIIKAEVAAATREYLQATRAATVSRFDEAFAVIDAAIANAPNEDVRRDLEAKRAALSAARDEALAQVDSALANLA